MKQALVTSVSLPGQLAPPFIGGGWLQTLLLRKTDPPNIPHVLEHVSQGDQELHPPSRGEAKKKRKVIKNDSS